MSINDFVQVMLVVLVCMARSGGVVYFLPILVGHPVSSRLIKSSIMLTISIPVIFVYRNLYIFIDLPPTYFAVILLKEFILGLFMSFTAAIPFWAIEVAGFFLDTMRGASMAEIFNVVMKTQTSIFGILFSLIINVLFFSVGGLDVLLEQFYRSYMIIPVIPVKLHFSHEWIAFVEGNLMMLFSLALVFSLPAILIMLINDISLGLINVSAKELNVFYLSMPIKSVLALFLIIITINYSIPNYISYFQRTGVYINQMVHYLQ